MVNWRIHSKIYNSDTNVKYKKLWNMVATCEGVIKSIGNIDHVGSEKYGN